MEGDSSNSAVSGTWNKNNPSIRRIMADVRELARDPSDQYAAQPLEENMFEWHFAIRGPEGTDFEGGVYHGRILLPSDYPFKPPNIMLLTPNGRWELNTKICLSISAYHPEEWQPAWGIRTILEALVSFMTAPAEGSVGALEYTPEERRKLAKESQNYTHKHMPKLPELAHPEARAASQNKYKDEIAKMHLVAPIEPSANEKPQDNASATPNPAPAPDVTAPVVPAPLVPAPGVPAPGVSASGVPAPAPVAALPSQLEDQEETLTSPISSGAPTSAVPMSTSTPAPAPAQASTPASTSTPAPRASSPSRSEQARDPEANPSTNPTQGGTASRRANPVPERRTDWLLYYAIVLSGIIFAILYRKALRMVRDEV
mmetsp:Transcript_5507/g.10350  ORF Transcript_5507/g.10350 Transcript_5507/m.10350 type:complete len:372 (+) Transcript_5507:382-1497(+)